MIKLNPLIKIENINQDKCLVSLLIDQKKYEINKSLFLSFLNNYGNGYTRDVVEANLSEELNIDRTKISNFLDNLYEKKFSFQIFKITQQNRLTIGKKENG